MARNIGKNRTTASEGEEMSKILGVLAAVLLVCATAYAKPQKTETTGPPDSTKIELGSKAVQGSEIDICFGNIAEVAIVGSEIGVIFGQTAMFFGSDSIASTIATLTGSCETIEVGCNNLAFLIWSPSKVAITGVGDSNIELYFDRVAGSDLMIFGQTAFFMGEVEATYTGHHDQAFDSAISILFDSAKLAIFMGEVETTQPLPGAAFDSAIVVLLNSAKLAFIHHRHSRSSC